MEYTDDQEENKMYDVRNSYFRLIQHTAATRL